MARAEATSDDQVTQWGTFRLGDEIYGVNVMQIREVLRYTEITPVPGAPYFVLGIINLRGNVVTVIDTRTRFGLGLGEVDNNTRIVIVEVDKQVIGMLVDSVAEVTYLNESEIEKAPNVGNEETSKFITGVCNKHDELLILIDLERMIDNTSSGVGMAMGF
ncbi:MAG: chemotaxis protein CheW [Pseudomonadales bacterium]|nr:chemotaxis protein CheW [Pseudomonadales bacterium]RLU02584.1 MAG: chemotaxis protein CheW [Ketobacter sp.]